MDDKLTFKNIIIVVLIILCVLSIIFGAYLPFVKSSRFIGALSSINSIKTVDQFTANFDTSFKFYSPIGDEEVAKFLANDIMQFISQKNQPEAVSRILVNYIEPYMLQNDIRHLLASGQMYAILWGNYGKAEDFKKAEDYFNKAYRIGPNLPPVLYSMLNLYQMKGDVQKMKEIGGEILKYWPDEKNVAELIGNLNK